MRAIFFAVVLIGLTACTTMNNNSLNSPSWRGKSADLLMQSQGAPKAIMPAVNGNTLFVYVTETRESYPSSMSNPSTIVGPHGKAIAPSLPATSNTNNAVVGCMTTFEVNKQHVIVSVTSKGIHC